MTLKIFFQGGRAETLTKRIKEKQKSVSIKKYRNIRELNLGILLFAVVFIYLIVTVIMYLTDDQISVYEVREGSIVRDDSYTGLVLREEITVPAEGNGYVSYYQNENTKVKAGSNIYALSAETLDTKSTSASEDNSTSEALNAEVQTTIAGQLQSFNEVYHSTDFSSVYSLKNEITEALQNAYSETRTSQLDAVINASGQNVTSYKTTQDGIVAFSYDGYESLTKDTFNEESFDRTVYESTTLNDQSELSAGDPAYRLITSEDWSVIVPLDDSTAQELTDREISTIQVRIEKDRETLRASFSIIERDGKYYGCLDFDNSMIRYAQDRFLSIELILEAENGLKIPKSSVIEEEFYVIPEAYLTTGGNSSSQGVMVMEGSGNAVFRSVNIYNTTDDGDVYLSRDEIEEGTTLIMPDSNETFTVGETKPLQGVYNINRGYAVFNKVSILCENDEYYIVQEGDTYGLSNYDHIVQDGEGIDPDEVVFQ